MTTQNKEYQSIINNIRHFFDAKENDFIPLHAPNFKGNEKKYLNEINTLNEKIIFLKKENNNLELKLSNQITINEKIYF